MQERVKNYISKIEQTDAKVSRAKAKLEEGTLIKANLDFIKEQDRIENTKRIQEMQEYTR